MFQNCAKKTTLTFSAKTNFVCSLLFFRDLLKEKKATIPLLAEKLTNELVIHISVS